MGVTPAQPLKCKSKYDRNFNRIYTGQFQVIADLYEGPNTVQQAPGLPSWGSRFIWGLDVDNWAFVNGSDADPIERIRYEGRDCWKWVVTITWSTEPSNRAPAFRGSPLDEPPVMSGSFIGSTKPVYRDVDDVLIATSSGEPYNPPPEINSGIDTFNISFNTPRINLGLRATMIGRVNSDPMWGLNYRQILMNQWRWQLMYYGNIPYIRNDLEFLINQNPTPSQSCTGLENEAGWYTVLPNQGLAPLSTANNKATRRQKKDDMDQPLTAPVPLKCDGTESTTETWNVFAVELENDFLLIPGLPATLPGPFE